jgi:MFS family permease
MLATPGHLTFIWISGLVEALSWGGINPAMFNLSVASMQRELRMSYMAILGAVTGIVGCLFGTMSGQLLSFLLPHDHYIGGFHWTGYHSLFTISALFRMQAWRLLKNVHEPHAWRARDVLRAGWGKFAGVLR